MVSVTSARPSGGPRGRAGEDDVLHLAAAQRLCALLPITQASASTTLDLPEPLGPHHAGDARLEAQSRRRREGLEALQRQTLEGYTSVSVPAAGSALAEARHRLAGLPKSATTLSTVPGCRPRAEFQQALAGGRGPAPPPAPGRPAGCSRSRSGPSSRARGAGPPAETDALDVAVHPGGQPGVLSHGAGDLVRPAVSVTSKVTVVPALEGAPDRAGLVDGAVDDDQQTLDLGRREAGQVEFEVLLEQRIAFLLPVGGPETRSPPGSRRRGAAAAAGRCSARCTRPARSSAARRGEHPSSSSEPISTSAPRLLRPV